MHFTKLQGLGNDYVFLDCTRETPGHLPELAQKLSDRHFGVGGDGLICLCPSQIADFKMQMFNADGSQGETCGNGLRCLGKLIFDLGLTDQNRLSIETPAGVKT
ncbi:MAG: diaminopimelate epimerase, partial [Pseudoflavonifractor sp.]